MVSLKIPKLLLDELESKNWQNGFFDQNIRQLLTELGLNQDLDIFYYNRLTIEIESNSFHKMMESDDKEEIDMFVGKYSKNDKNKTIAPELTMLIADFGLGSDQPIALDYRRDLSQPEVWMLVWDRNNYWTKISSTFENFINGKK